MGGIKVLELGVLSHSVMSDSHDPMACSPPDSSVHAIFQARILECCHFLRQVDLPNPGIEPMSLASLALAGRFFTSSATWKAP